MYPTQYFSLFPPYPHDETVFIAMSFRPEMDARWNNVIAPAVSDLSVDGTGLRPVRVDARTVSDSILTEILRGIGRALLVFADISAINGSRNGNVMYEVGIAHATRLPEEVVLFRDDNDNLLFDVSNIRVNKYDPDREPAAARQKVALSLESALREVNLLKNLTVQRALEALDFDAYNILAVTSRSKELVPPVVRTMQDALSSSRHIAAIQRLLELGLICTKYQEVNPDDFKPETHLSELIRYQVTPLGDEVLHAVGQRCFSKVRDQLKGSA